MAAEWAGDWDTDFGDLTLQVRGQDLSGSYQLERGTRCHGRVQGVVRGNVAKGIWRQSTCEPGGVPWGYFELEWEGDDTFSGHWRYGSHGGWDGTWEGEKE